MSSIYASKNIKEVSINKKEDKYFILKLENGDVVVSKEWRLTFVEDGQKHGPYVYLRIDEEGQPEVTLPWGKNRADTTLRYLSDNGVECDFEGIVRLLELLRKKRQIPKFSFEFD